MDLWFVGGTVLFFTLSLHTSPAAAGCGEAEVAVEHVVGPVVSVVLLGSLAYALLRPERF